VCTKSECVRFEAGEVQCSVAVLILSIHVDSIHCQAVDEWYKVYNSAILLIDHRSLVDNVMKIGTLVPRRASLDAVLIQLRGMDQCLMK